MNKTYYFQIVSIMLVLFPSFLAAETEFNPNFLISDEEMQSYQSMNREDIQAFLNDKKGAIRSMKFPDKDNMSREASDIIYRAAQEHRINPKYLLVKLQKEQSLISEDNPTQKQLDWATGYGICDNCSMSDPALQKHRGFGTQVDSAAGIIRWYYDNQAKESWIKRANTQYSIDGRAVTPANFATAFLYTYTPHIQGNKNFWTLWQRWFDQVYPDGTLMKTPDDPTVYLIRDKKKHPFANMGALTSRFNPKLIVTVPTSELGNYESAKEIALPNYAILKQGTKHYLLDDNTIRPFENNQTVKLLGYHPDEIIPVSFSDIAEYTTGKPITATTNPQGRIIRLKENKALYYIKDDQYFPIYDERIASTNYPALSIENVSATELGSLASGPAVLLKDGLLFGIEGENSIYVVEHGKKRHIVSEDVFNGLGYDWNNITWLNTFAGMAHETGQPVYLRRTIAKAGTDETTLAQVEQPTKASSQNNELMWTTPDSELAFIGKKFGTKVNTYLVAEYETEKILAGKNIDSVRPTASFTKVMTAYKLFEEGLQEQYSVAYDPTKHKATYHRYNIGTGDQVLNKDLLSAMLVSSLNTPVKMLVSSVEKNEKAFIKKMNDKAAEWGLTKTTFVDVAGEKLKTETTAREYLRIFKNASRDINVRKYLGMESYAYNKISNPSGKRKKHYDNHSNALVGKKNLSFTILASKTGYLDEAGDGLVMLIERPSDKKKFIVITMGNPDHRNRFDDPERLAEWVVDTF